MCGLKCQHGLSDFVFLGPKLFLCHDVKGTISACFVLHFQSLDQYVGHMDSVTFPLLYPDQWLFVVQLPFCST